MVRNTPSMQSLRSTVSVADLTRQQTESMSDRPHHTTFDLTANPTSNGTEDELQRSGRPATIQLKGQDAYTKDIMTKMATGKATQAEAAAFNDRVREARSMPSIKNLLQTEDEVPRLTYATHHVETTQPISAYHFPCTGPGEHITPQSPESRYCSPSSIGQGMQAMTLEAHQQLMASQTCFTGGLGKTTGNRGSRGDKEEENGGLQGNHALADYSHQLMLLEKQRQIREKMLESKSQGDSIDCHSAESRYRGPASIKQAMMSLEARQQVMAKALSHATSIGKQGQTLGCGRLPENVQAGKEAMQSQTFLEDYQRELMSLEYQNKARHKLFGDQGTRDACPAKIEIQKATHQNAAKYTAPFCQFLTDNPTVFHAVSAMKKDLKHAGWTELSERDAWDIKPSGRYFVERNGSSLIAFTVGSKYKSGNGAAILAGHVDALTARLKPISTVPNKAGYLQLGVSPYAGGLNSTWWDRDLGIGGRVHIKEGDKIVTKLVKLDWPIARIPTLAPHFGAAAQGPFNLETQMVPIIGLDSSAPLPFSTAEPFSQPSLLRGGNGSIGSFVHTQPPALVKVIAEALGLHPNSIRDIVNWELELFDVQPATVGGLNKEFIYAGRIDDKLCSWAALQALIESEANDTDSSLIKVVGLFDDEEIGSLLRQGARGNFLPTIIERAVGSLADHHPSSDLMGRTYANSFLVSSDVTHAVNPNFLNAYLENHAPHLNVGVAVAADSNGHMTTDSVSTTILHRCAELADAKLQVFQIRNDSRSGGTVGPMLSSALGVRAVDAGLPQLSMHSIRATTGALDPGLGVILFGAFLSGFEKVDREFR